MYLCRSDDDDDVASDTSTSPPASVTTTSSCTSAAVASSQVAKTPLHNDAVCQDMFITDKCSADVTDSYVTSFPHGPMTSAFAAAPAQYAPGAHNEASSYLWELFRQPPGAAPAPNPLDAWHLPASCHQRVVKSSHFDQLISYT